MHAHHELRPQIESFARKKAPAHIKTPHLSRDSSISVPCCWSATEAVATAYIRGNPSVTHDSVAVTALGMLVWLLLAAAARGRQHVHWLSMQPVKIHEGQSTMQGSRLEISQGMLSIWTNDYFYFKPDRMCEMRPLREIHLRTTNTMHWTGKRK
jgi:hypothetical protein